MTKKEQIADNAIIEQYIDELNAEISADGLQYCGRLRSCQAHVYSTKHFIVLRLVYGYSSASAQHIAKFKKDYYDGKGFEYTWRDCR